MCMDKYIRKYRTSTCSIIYHIVWVVKHEQPVLSEDICTYLISTIKEIGKSKSFDVLSCEIKEHYYVDCIVSSPPTLSITDIVKYLKGISGRKTLEQYPEIKSQLVNGELWNHSYFCETVGQISDICVQDYLARQKKFLLRKVLKGSYELLCCY